MNEIGKKVWMDGELVDVEDANVTVFTQTLHYGMGVFEGIRCYRLSDGRSAIFRLEKHVRRMFDGMKILSMEAPFTEAQIIEAHVKLAKVNGMEECYLRPIMYCDAGAMGLAAINKTRVAIMSWKWGVYLGEGALENGIRAKVSSFNRHHVNVGMVQGKLIGQYVTSIIAKREVMRAGYQEAIMLDTQGYVAECSGENLFCVKDGLVYTAPTSSPILPGVTRDTVMQLAREMNLEVKEERFTRDFMYLVDEVFLTGTAAEVTPVREIDDRTVGTGKPGPITQRLQQAYFDVVRGKNPKHKNWLSIV